MGSQLTPPNHYLIAGKIETLPIIEMALDSMAGRLTPYQSFLLGSLLKYRLRFGKKEGQDDGDRVKMFTFEKLLADSLEEQKVAGCD